MSHDPPCSAASSLRAVAGDFTDLDALCRDASKTGKWHAKRMLTQETDLMLIPAQTTSPIHFAGTVTTLKGALRSPAYLHYCFVLFSLQESSVRIGLSKKEQR